MDNFQLLEVYVMSGYRITEYVTRHGVRRCDMQSWKGEKELKLPVENTDGTWEVKVYPIEIYARPQDLRRDT